MLKYCSRVWIIAAVLATATACSPQPDDTTENNSSNEAEKLENSAGKSDQAAISLTLTDDAPEAAFSLACEEPEGCDIGLQITFDQGACGTDTECGNGEICIEGACVAESDPAATRTLLEAEFTRPDGFSKTLEFSAASENVEGLMGQEEGAYTVTLTKADGVGDISFSMFALWTEAHPTTEFLSETCYQDSDCASGYFCTSFPDGVDNDGNGVVDDEAGLCTIDCGDFGGLVCKNGYNGAGDPVCAGFEDDLGSICVLQCDDDTNCPSGNSCYQSFCLPTGSSFGGADAGPVNNSTDAGPVNNSTDAGGGTNSGTNSGDAGM